MLRPATRLDIEAISALHVDNWRRHYAGALDDIYLTRDAPVNRLERWRARLDGRATEPAATTVAVDGQGMLIGFVHTVFDADPDDGSLLDNLHVAHACTCGPRNAFDVGRGAGGTRP